MHFLRPSEHQLHVDQLLRQPQHDMSSDGAAVNGDDGAPDAALADTQHDDSQAAAASENDGFVDDGTDTDAGDQPEKPLFVCVDKLGYQRPKASGWSVIDVRTVLEVLRWPPTACSSRPCL
jgi:hypothetical protein